MEALSVLTTERTRGVPVEVLQMGSAEGSGVGIDHERKPCIAGNIFSLAMLQS